MDTRRRTADYKLTEKAYILPKCIVLEPGFLPDNLYYNLFLKRFTWIVRR